MVTYIALAVMIVCGALYVVRRQARLKSEDFD